MESLGVFLGLIGFAIFLDIVFNDGDAITKIIKAFKN